jgi:quercetin dioxygenase-like cupin family protein
MKLTSFQATSEGGSRFVEVEAPFALERADEFGHTIKISAAYASPAVQFVELPAGMDQDWHNAPARQLVVVLAGEIEVETTDGVCRRWRTGDAFVPADVTGRGHRTRSIGGAVRLLFAPLPEGFGFEGM